MCGRGLRKAPGDIMAEPTRARALNTTIDRRADPELRGEIAVDLNSELIGRFTRANSRAVATAIPFGGSSRLRLFRPAAAARTAPPSAGVPRG